MLLVTRPVDFHKGPQRLAALAAQVICEDLFSGAMIVFGCKRTERIKLLVIYAPPYGEDPAKVTRTTANI